MDTKNIPLRKEVLNQVCLQNLFEKFIADPEDPSLADSEKVLLNQMKLAKDTIVSKSEKIKGFQEDIVQKQKEIDELNKQIIFEEGRFNGLSESLLSVFFGVGK